MSLEKQQARDVASGSKADDGEELNTQLAIICTAWILGALFLGIAFVAFSDVFAALL